MIAPNPTNAAVAAVLKQLTNACPGYTPLNYTVTALRDDWIACNPDSYWKLYGAKTNITFAVCSGLESWDVARQKEITNCLFEVSAGGSLNVWTVVSNIPVGTPTCRFTFPITSNLHFARVVIP